MEEKIKNTMEINIIGFNINYNNEIIKMLAYPYDIMTNMIMFGTYYPAPRFYELPILEYVKSKFNGGVALDIGACIGNHSIYFSKFVFDKVFSFEPDMRNFTILLKNKEINNIDDNKLVIYNVALSDGNYEYNIQENKINMGGTQVIEGNGELLTKKLDDFELPKIDFIKIDVEEHELKVLKGAINLINRDYPDIILECNIYAESSFEIIDSYMEILNYRLIESFGGYNMFYYKHRGKF